MGAPRSTPVDEELEEEGRRHEVLGIITGAAAVLVALSLYSYDARGGENLIGPVGTGLAGVLATAFGVGAWVLPVELLMTTLRLFRRRSAVLGVATLAATLVIVLVGCSMLHLVMTGETVYGGHAAGGVLGEVLGEILRAMLGLTGAYVIGAAVLLITLVLRSPISIAAVGARAGRAIAEGATAAARGAVSLFRAWREAKRLEREAREAERARTAPKIIPHDVELADDDEVEEKPLPGPAGAVLTPAAETETESESESEAESEAGEEKPRGRKKKAGGPRIVAPVTQSSRHDDDGPPPPPPGPNGPFLLPPPSLLDEPPPSEIRIDPETLKSNAVKLVEKLSAYGVRGRVDEIHPGPVVTMYEFEPESGTKLAKISNLADDLAMAMAAQKVRIVAPIPGKARVGFELPNDDRQMVHLREILEDERWRRMHAMLPIAFGKDIAGNPVYGDLAKMPHLLVAGATGQGKSVGINVMLVSLLAQKTPEEVRLLMIDPKVVELAVFDGIPHMLLPVVTDMKKAALALRWAVDEMERRYQLFADAGARNILTYNARVDRVLTGEVPVEKLVRDPALLGEAGPVRLPHIVVVVDEFADLMMVAAKDVETCVARLAQKARAAGIHVVLATQRPSVDVITGMIKANFPSRIAFKVSQREDSKTILGRIGAENLLGRGDMLLLPPGSSELRRVHGAYVSEDEVKSVCDFLRAQGKPVYDENITKPREDDEDEFGGGPRSDDPLYDKAVALVAQAGYCSISHLQRQLSVGYNKAAKLVERMEVEGVVGPASGKAGGRREVLVQPL